MAEYVLDLGSPHRRPRRTEPPSCRSRRRNEPGRHRCRPTACRQRAYPPADPRYAPLTDDDCRTLVVAGMVRSWLPGVAYEFDTDEETTFVTR